MQAHQGIFINPIMGGWLVYITLQSQQALPPGFTQEMLENMVTSVNQNMGQDELLKSLQPKPGADPKKAEFDIEGARDRTCFFFPSFLECLAFIQKHVKDEVLMPEQGE